MSFDQIREQFFHNLDKSIPSRRLSKLMERGFIKKSYVTGNSGHIQRIYAPSAKLISEITNSYRFEITNPLYESDSVNHDLILVDIRNRFRKFKHVTDYYTENMLQACGAFRSLKTTESFVINYTDAVLEFSGQAEKLFIGLEFENSEKSHDRYIKKLSNYYATKTTPLILFICSDARIRTAVMQAELVIAGNRDVRCAYAVLSDVLKNSEHCTFVDVKGDKFAIG